MGETRRAFWHGTPPPRRSDTDGLLLPKPPGLIRRFWLRHTLLADILIALLSFVGGYFESVDKGLGLGDANWLVSGWLVVPIIASASLLVRRTRPLLSLTAIFVCGGVLTLVTGTALVTPLLFAVYAVAVYGGTLKAWVGTAIGFGLNAILAVVIDNHVMVNVGVAISLLFALLFGTNIGNRRRYLDALIDRAAQLVRERDQEAQLATAAERSRIAREMHDVVAHSLSVMVRLADGADAIADADPERSRQTVRQIGEVGRDSLRDMRRLLGVLREDGQPELGPQPSLGELDRLIETYRSAGLPVAIRQTGTPPTLEGVQVAIYRAIQESLTNALRYSSQPSRVLIKLDYSDAGVQLDVTDDGIYTGPNTSVGSGRGLVGLRERAALYGGTIEAGPRRHPLTGQDGGWRVHMTLPHIQEDDR